MRKGDFKGIFALLLALFVLLTPLFPTTANASAGAYCVVDGLTGTVLYSHNADVKMPMASTTKIITAMTVINALDDLDKVYKIPREAVGVEGSSVYLKEGEEVSVRELLYCLMLRSGNDSAVALSIITAGSVQSFAKLMNKTASDLGATSTNLVNPHGLHHEEHYTTARDLAIISAKAMQNDVFREIVSAKSYVGKRTTYYNKNKLLSNFEGADGVKTGYTKVAGRCFVGSATDGEGNRIVTALLNCPDTYGATATLTKKAFEEYSFLKIESKDKAYEVNINGIPKRKVKASLLEDVVIPIKKGEEERVKTKLVITPSLDFPVKKGEIVGNLQIYRENELLFSYKIATIQAVGINELLFN